MDEEKNYSSGKHKLYRYNMKLSIFSIGTCIGCTKRYPASVLDLETFRQNKHFHHEASKIIGRDLNVEDQGLLKQMQQNCWIILKNKGYQGGKESL